MKALVSSIGDGADHAEMSSKFSFVNNTLAKNVDLYTEHKLRRVENPFCGKA